MFSFFNHIVCLSLLVPATLIRANPLEYTRQEPSISGLESRTLANGAALRILCLGASITYGYESTDGNGYRYGLHGALVNNGNTVNMIGSLTHGTMLNNQNEGWTGFRIAEVAQKAEISLPSMPNLVLIHVGTNDMAQDYEVSTAHIRLATLIDRIFQVVPNVAIVVSTLLPNANASTEANVQIFNKNLPAVVSARAAAGKRIALVDMSCDWFSVADLHADGTHPTDEGYLKMAKVFYNGIMGLSSQISAPVSVANVNDQAAQNDIGAETAVDAVCQTMTGSAAQKIQCGVNVASSVVTTSTVSPKVTPLVAIAVSSTVSSSSVSTKPTSTIIVPVVSTSTKQSSSVVTSSSTSSPPTSVRSTSLQSTAPIPIAPSSSSTKSSISSSPSVSISSAVTLRNPTSSSTRSSIASSSSVSISSAVTLRNPTSSSTRSSIASRPSGSTSSVVTIRNNYSSSLLYSMTTSSTSISLLVQTPATTSPTSLRLSSTLKATKSSSSSLSSTKQIASSVSSSSVLLVSSTKPITASSTPALSTKPISSSTSSTSAHPSSSSSAKQTIISTSTITPNTPTVAPVILKASSTSSVKAPSTSGVRSSTAISSSKTSTLSSSSVTAAPSSQKTTAPVLFTGGASPMLNPGNVYLVLGFLFANWQFGFVNLLL